jgi:hypothetical protein
LQFTPVTEAAACAWGWLAYNCGTFTQYSMWIITVRGPSIEHQEFVLPAGKFTIGRSPGNDIVLPDEAASPEHAELVFELTTDALSVHDLGSANGTFVNHEHITGPRIKFGLAST